MRSSVDVHNYLLERDIAHELVPTRGRLPAADQIPAVLGLPPEQVGRVVLLEGHRSPVAVLVPAGRRVQLGRVARAVRTPTLTEVTPERATDLTGYLAEATPPVALPDGTRVIIDRALADQEVLYFPGGETQSLLKIRAADLVRATEAKVARVAR